MTIYLLFLLGVLSYVLVDWAHWKIPGTAWSGYWRQHSAPAIANAIMTLMMFLAWQGKVLGGLLAIVGFNTESSLLAVQVDVLIAPVAGFVLSLLTTLVSKKIWPHVDV